MANALTLKINTKEFDEAIGIMLEKFPENLRKIVYRGETIFEGEIIENLSRKQRWGQGGKWLGEGDPNVLGLVTGRLRASVRAMPPKMAGNTVKGTINTGGGVNAEGGTKGMGVSGSMVGQMVKYARKHEFGLGVSRRPYVQPAFESKKDEVASVIRGEIVDFLKSKGHCPHCGLPI
ncbi:hypothetical protein KKC52_12605 [bacterium]|nr:hypothetical protein [bacterium]